MNMKEIRCGLDASDLGLSPLSGSCERSSEPSGSLEGGEFC